MFSLLFITPLLLLGGLAYARTTSSSSWRLAHFTSYLAAVLRQNLPLGSSLSAYAQELPGWRFFKRRMLLEIADHVDNGWFLADAVDRYPAQFPLYFRALVRAGEDAGNLGLVLDRLAEKVDADARQAARAVGVSLYPALLCTVAWLMTSLLLLAVIPKFAEMLAETAENAPPPTWLLALSHSAQRLSLVALLVFGGVATFGFVGPGKWRSLAGSVKPVARAASWLKWHVPFFSRYERRRAAAQYTLAAGRLMEAGIATHEALRIAASASGNHCLDGIAARAADLVEEGRTFSEALESVDPRRRLPPELHWCAKVGERSGRLPEALARASNVCEARSRSVLSRYVSLIFPAGILTVGLAVGILGYSIFGMLLAVMQEAGL